MKLSRKKAIELCIEMWTWLAKTGKDKSEWPKWEEFGVILSLCWFCQYDQNQCRRYERFGHDWFCYYCPYHKKYGDCQNENSPYSHWVDEMNINARKKYAKLFLEQIKTLRR